MLGQPTQITVADLNSILEAENDEIVESWAWHNRKRDALINTVADVSLTTVGVTQGSSTVTAAGFASGMENRSIRIAGIDGYYRIVSVVVGVSGVIGDDNGAVNWPAATNASATATVFQNLFEMPTDAERILLPSGAFAYPEATRAEVDIQDPDRTNTATNPFYYVTHRRRVVGADDVLLIEFWPRTSSPVSIRVPYLRRGAIGTDSDRTIYRSDVLRWKAGETAAWSLFNRTGEATYRNSASDWHVRYLESLKAAIEDDLLKYGAMDHVRDVETSGAKIGDDFLASHDVESLA